MSDLAVLTILLGLLTLAVIGLFWLMFRLEKRVGELRATVVQIELEEKL